VPLLGDVTISGAQPAAVMADALRRATKPEKLTAE
jgi:predicted DsbA family dithiol-disulfide isomerase